MDLLTVAEEYITNYRIALGFGILLVFVIFFAQFSGLYISSGSIFMEYNLMQQNFFTILPQIGAILIYLAMFSTFVTLLVFAVKNDLNVTKRIYYFTEKMQKFGARVFVFYAIMIAALSLLGALLIAGGASTVVTALILLVVSLPFIFVVQALIVEECSLRNAILYNFEFISENIDTAVYVIVISAALLAGLQIAEFYFDSFALSGKFVSLLIMLVLVVPLIEITKTSAYMMQKFTIVKKVL